MTDTSGFSAQESARRERAVAAALTSSRLEGFADDPAWNVELQRFVRGELSGEQLVALAVALAA